MKNKFASFTETASSRGLSTAILAMLRLFRTKLETGILGRRFLQRRIHDWTMMLDSQDMGLSRSLLLFGTREVDHKIMLEHLVKPGMRVFDVGGNLGYYPLMELNLLKGTGELIVVEPFPDNIKLLKENLVLNGFANTPVRQAAVSNQKGRRSFHLSSQSNLGTFHPEGTGSETLTGKTIEVETTTIPALAEEFGAPDLIRMDVEGHEVEVIDGMLDEIKAGNLAPSIIFETHLTRYGGDHDFSAVLERLFSLGYKVTQLSSSSESGTERLTSLGYKAGKRIATDGIHRTLFDGISNEDAISIICKTGGSRTVLLQKE
ncbi:FkbM family methyltransferase [uncultured Thalassospira sp.]|uniref:FkbM family methyltransferase n=1 Tax=uncultured Thalassospira sp. TaxID=404382 RepID=UPI0025852938|nr:FkbM family methyltransferase [uncultured Thalassospira sp.]